MEARVGHLDASRRRQTKAVAHSFFSEVSQKDKLIFPEEKTFGCLSSASREGEKKAARLARVTGCFLSEAKPRTPPPPLSPTPESEK